MQLSILCQQKLVINLTGHPVHFLHSSLVEPKVTFPTWQLVVTEVEFSDVGEVVERLRWDESQPVRRHVQSLETEST